MDAYDHYRYSFESCKSYTNGAVSPNDFARICGRYKLDYKIVMEHVNTDGEGRFTLDSFIHYLKRQSQMAYTNHAPSRHSSYAHEVDSYVRPTSPVRPSSVSKVMRQAVYPGVSHHHSRSGGLRYPPSPNGREDNDDMNDDLGVRRTRTPDNFLSSDEKPRHSERLRNDSERYRGDMYEHNPVSARSRMSTHSRTTMDTPPPTVTHHSSRSRYRGDMIAGRSDKLRSSFKDSDDDDVMQDYYQPTVPSRSSRHKHSVNDGHEGGGSKSRRETGTDRSRNKDCFENPDLAYAQLYRENEKLKQKLQSMKKDSISESGSPYLERQFDELKKAKEDAEEELRREKSSHKAMRKECHALKQECNSLHSKIEELYRNNWRLSDENHKLNIKLMEEDPSFSRRPGDGGSGEPSARSSYASELSFQRTHLRQTYHGTGKGEVSKDTSSRSRSKGRPEMKRVSSEGKPLAYDDSGKDNYSNYPKAKTHKSGTSSAGSIMDSLALTMVSTTPDEQSQVFMVLGEDVSKSVLPEGLPKDKELAMMYALQNCHSVQELIKSLVSYGVSTNSDQLQGFQVENVHLQERIEHLKAKNNTISHSFQSAKLNMDEMYHTAERIESNNVRLRHALKTSQQACEAFEVLLELRSGDPRNNPSSASYFPSFDSSLDSTLTRSPDREQVSIKHTAMNRARTLLHILDSNVELQNYLPVVRNMQRGSGDYHQHMSSNWLPGTLSQNTGTTSGLSSMSGGIEGDITQAELDRLKQYTQALLHYKNHLVTTLVTVNGLEGLDTIKKSVIVKDCYQADASGSITELEDAAHAEELCKVREEKAELRSQIYMMEQEKRRMELEVSRMISHKQKCDKQISELQFLLRDEKRKRKKEQKKRKGESIPGDLSLEYASLVEREREISRRYEDLFCFLQSHIKDSQETTEHLMTFVKELRRANSALVDAFEKSKKRQQAEKKRMKTELVSYMNRIQGDSGQLLDEPIPA